MRVDEFPRDRFPVRNWEHAPARIRLPESVMRVLSTHSSLLRVSRHAWSRVQPPPPGVPLTAAGESFKGPGLHWRARPFFDVLGVILDHWAIAGPSKPGKGAQSHQSWGFYIPTGPGEDWVAIVIGMRLADGEAELVTIYLIEEVRVYQRVKMGSYFER